MDDDAYFCWLQSRDVIRKKLKLERLEGQVWNWVVSLGPVASAWSSWQFEVKSVALNFCLFIVVKSDFYSGNCMVEECRLYENCVVRVLTFLVAVIHFEVRCFQYWKSPYTCESFHSGIARCLELDLVLVLGHAVLPKKLKISLSRRGFDECSLKT